MINPGVPLKIGETIANVVLGIMYKDRSDVRHLDHYLDAFLNDDLTNKLGVLRKLDYCGDSLIVNGNLLSVRASKDWFKLIYSDRIVLEETDFGKWIAVDLRALYFVSYLVYDHINNLYANPRKKHTPKSFHTDESRTKYIQNYLDFRCSHSNNENIISDYKNEYVRILSKKYQLDCLEDICEGERDWLIAKYESLSYQYFGRHMRIDHELLCWDKLKIEIQSRLDIEVYISKRDHFRLLNVENFLKAFRTAWSQKKFQLKKKDLTAFNTHLDSETALKFNKLQKKHGFNKSDMLTYLVSLAYKEMK